MSRLVGQAAPRFSERQTSFEVTHQSALATLEDLKAAGVRVPPSGRVGTSIRQFSLAHDLITQQKMPDRLKLDHLHRALLDIAEIRLILDQLPTPPEVPGWIPKMNLAMKGEISPAKEKKNSRAWDYQFELFVAAVFRRAGYELALEEPDVVIREDGQHVGIAAKRPRSLSNFNKLIKRADEQISDSDYPGVVAIDISYLTNPKDRVVMATGDFGLQHIRDTVHTFLNDNHERMLARVNPEHTFGVIVYGSILVLDLEVPRFSVARSSVFGNFCGLHDPRLKLLTSIRNKVTLNA